MFPQRRIGCYLIKVFVFLAIVAFPILVSCSDKNKSPAQITENCFQSLAKGDFDKASKSFPEQKQDLKWAETYFGEQNLGKIFKVQIDDTIIIGNNSIVTYTPEEVLTYGFDGKCAAMLSRKDGAWKIDLKESLQFMSIVAGGGITLELNLLKSLADKATEKSGKPPSSIQRLLDAEEEPSMRKRLASWAENYDYYPEGADMGGQSGVIFYSKNPLKPGVYPGISNDRYFLSDGTKVFLSSESAKH